MNRVQPTEKQPSVTIISGVIFIIFFDRENFEQAALNIQIWVRVLHNIKTHKCYFLGLVALSPKFNTKILHKRQMGRLLERCSYIICELRFRVICRLIDIALHGKKL